MVNGSTYTTSFWLTLSLISISVRMRLVLDNYKDFSDCLDHDNIHLQDFMTTMIRREVSRMNGCTH